MKTFLSTLAFVCSMQLSYARTLKIEDYRSACEQGRVSSKETCASADFFGVAWRDPYDLSGNQEFNQITGHIWTGVSSDPVLTAQMLNRLPKGRRALYLWDAEKDEQSVAIHSNALDRCSEGFSCLPWTNGTQSVRNRHENFFKGSLLCHQSLHE